MKKLEVIEIICRGVLSIMVVIIAGLYLHRLELSNDVEILFNVMLVVVVMNWGINIMKEPLW